MSSTAPSSGRFDLKPRVNNDSVSERTDIASGTTAAHAVGIASGCRILRAHDVVAARRVFNDVFTRHSLVSLRVSDYGWNGLGVPMERQDGSGESIQDRFYKNVEGLFGPAEPSAEDMATYLEYVETILIPALEGGS